jgi:transposase
MPAPYPVEFRQRAVELARENGKPVSESARDIGVSETCLRNWLNQADIDEGRKQGVSSSEREELARLRKENRVLRLERDLLSRAAAFFASENVLPK